MSAAILIPQVIAAVAMSIPALKDANELIESFIRLFDSDPEDEATPEEALARFEASVTNYMKESEETDAILDAMKAAREAAALVS